MRKTSFITVTDRKCFLGTVAGVRSLLFHNRWVKPGDITVGYRRQHLDEIEAHQLSMLKSMGVEVLTEDKFFVEGRQEGPWEMKTYMMAELSQVGETIVLFDADLFFTGNIKPYVQSKINVQGGLDGGETQYDETWNSYDFKTPAVNPYYVSSSCLILNVNIGLKAVLARAVEVTQHAAYNKSGPFKGHGDQGVFNACLFEYNETHGEEEGISIRPLANRLWSHHWTLEDDHFGLSDKGQLVNLTANEKPVYSIHCGGKFPKPWDPRFPRDCFTDQHFWVGAAFYNFLFSNKYLWPVPIKHLLTEKAMACLVGALQFSPSFVPSLNYGQDLLEKVFPKLDPDLFEALSGLPSGNTACFGGSWIGLALSLFTEHDVTRYQAEWPQAHPLEKYRPNLACHHVKMDMASRLIGVVEVSVIAHKMTSEQILRVVDKSKSCYALKGYVDEESIPEQIKGETDYLWILKN